MKQIILRELGGARRRSKVMLLVSTDGAYPLTNILQVSLYGDGAKIAVMNEHEAPVVIELTAEQLTAIVEQWEAWTAPRCKSCGVRQSAALAHLLRCAVCESLYCEACGEEHMCQ